MSTTPENTPPEIENAHHKYTTNRIPLWVRLMWVVFWAFAIYYALNHFVPAFQTEWLQK